MQRTAIEWTDFSAALLKYRDADGKSVHACVKISPGCANCYAESIAQRFERRRYTLPMTRDTKPFFDDREAGVILRSKALAAPSTRRPGPSMVFIDDMTDLFGDWVSDAIIDNHFRIFADRPDVVFQVLTKRAARLCKYSAEIMALSPRQRMKRFAHSHYEGHPAEGLIRENLKLENCGDLPWPLPNVWLGVSVEDQQRAYERIPHLLNTPAAIRFLSCEPLLGPIDMKAVRLRACDAVRAGWPDERKELIDWVIAGGESGHNARAMHPDWVRSLRDQCTAAGVPFFFKQWGEWKPDKQSDLVPEGFVAECSIAEHNSQAHGVFRVGKKLAGRLLDDREWSEFPACVSRSEALR